MGGLIRHLPRLLVVLCVLALVVVCAALVWLPGGPAPRTAAAPAAATLPQPVNRDVLDLLDTLPVKGRAPKTGYARTQFQHGNVVWGDPDHNRCDTRNDILRRDLDPDAPVPGSRCLVATGTLQDPYTGLTITFVRGATTSNDVQIDHVVALSNAWQTGAQQLSPDERVALANDPLELLAVDGPTNGAKGDGDAATWLPPNKAERCDYVARQVAVKARYRLWVTPGEHDAIAGVLAGCPGQGLPDGYQK